MTIPCISITPEIATKFNLHAASLICCTFNVENLTGIKEPN